MVTWWITIKSVPEEEVLLDEHHQTSNDILLLVSTHMYENVVIEIGMDYKPHKTKGKGVRTSA